MAIAPMNISPRLLLGPGPSDAHPNVLRAMTTPLLGHLGRPLRRTCLHLAPNPKRISGLVTGHSLETGLFNRRPASRYGEAERSEFGSFFRLSRFRITPLSYNDFKARSTASKDCFLSLIALPLIVIGITILLLYVVDSITLFNWLFYFYYLLVYKYHLE